MYQKVMRQKGGERTVLRLEKALYGTKQAPHEWNEELNKFILSIGFKRSEKESCVYFKKSRTGGVIIIPVFVDDITGWFAKRDEDEWLGIKEQFMDKYEIED